MVINATRGHAAEFGVIAAKGPVNVAELLQQAHSEEASVPALALDMLRLSRMTRTRRSAKGYTRMEGAKRASSIR